MLSIAVVTPFPLVTEPYRGAIVYHQSLEMASWADISVYVPHPHYPRVPLLQPKTFLYQREDFAAPTPGIDPHFLEYPTVPVIGRRWNGRLIARQLLPLLRKRRPDVVLSYNIYPDGCGAMLAAQELGVPVVVGALGSDLRRISGRAVRKWVERTVRTSDYVLGVSRELVERAQALGADPSRTKVIASGFDANLFAPRDRAAARTTLGVPADTQLILFVGRLVPLKGVAELLEALAEVRQKAPRAELVCLGDGPLLQTLQQQAEAHTDTQGKVRFLGNRPMAEVADWLAASDLLCLPSHSEGAPNVIIEALGSGRPVVATTVGGIPDMVKPETGQLVPPREPKQLAAALLTVLGRPWDADAISRSVQRTWRQMAEETYAVCCEVIERR